MESGNANVNMLDGGRWQANESLVFKGWALIGEIIMPREMVWLSKEVETRAMERSESKRISGSECVLVEERKKC